MTDVDDEDLPEFSEDVVAQQAADREVLAAHDPMGLDLAAQIAHRAAASTGGVALPRPRGVSRRPRAPRVEGGQRSGAHPDDRDPQQVGDVLGRLVQARGWSTQINVRTLVARWPDMVGQLNAEHSEPEAFSDGVLVVRADSSTWAASLRTIAPQVVAELNRRLGDGSVTRIQVVGPTAPSWKKGPLSVRDGRGPRDTYG